MSEYLIQEETLTGIADAIRAKGHSYAERNNDIVVSDMASRIRKLDNLNYAVYVSNTFNATEVNNMYDGVRDNIIWIKSILDGTIYDIEHLNLYINSTTGVVTAASSNTVYTKYIKCAPTTDYTFILDNAQTVLIAGFDEVPATGVTGTIIYGAGKTNAEATLEKTVSSGNYKYLGIWYYDSSTNDSVPNITIRCESLHNHTIGNYDYIISNNCPSNLKNDLIWIKTGSSNNNKTFNAIDDSIQVIATNIDTSWSDGEILINPISVKICKSLNGEYVWVSPKAAVLYTNNHSYDILNPTESIKDEIAELIEGELVDIENEDVTKIRNYGFYSNQTINEIHFPNCSYVGLSAFASCTNLNVLDLPACTSVYNKSVFIGCTNLNSVTLGYPSMTSTINPLASAKTKITTLNLPNCSSIGAQTFSGYTGLTSVSFPVCTSVANVNAFTGCSKIENITLGYPSVEYSNFPFRVAATSQTIKVISLPNCSKIGPSQGLYYTNNTDYTIKSVYYSTPFYNCYTIEEAYLPVCTEIAECAFYSCSNLTYVSAPNCETVNGRAFYDCSSLSIINLPKCTAITNTGCYRSNSDGSSESTHLDSLAFAYCTNLTSVSLPVCTTIGSGAFTGCSNLTSISLPACITIGGNAFNGCSNLTSVSLPVCTTIGNGAFTDCLNLTSISLPACTSIGNNAFNGCSNLTSVSLPACTYIAFSAFHDTNLSYINLPACTSLYGAFSSNYKLVSVSLPVCKTIGASTFNRCSNLTSISLPACTTIGSYAFYSCSNLTALYLPSTTVATLALYAFYNTPMSLSTLTGKFGSIYVPASLVSAYKTAVNWSAYASRITAIT